VKSMLLLTLVCLVAATSALGAEHLCPTLTPLPAGSDDLRITEDEISPAKYRESLKYLRTEFPKRLRALSVGADADTTEGFWLSYFNSLTFIEGYTLKTAALLERAQSPSKTDGPAQVHFCAWLQKQKYVD
jgi:hypothetical protein